MSTPYNPRPIDTSDIELSDELKRLVEHLAHNVHESWALGRLNDGWTYGPKRNDALKQHPCLVEYDDLPESEKDYDRKTVVTTLKTILQLGWNIEKNPTTDHNNESKTA
jgi:ryanodine receptor 2